MIEDTLAIAVLYGTVPTEAPSLRSLGAGLEQAGASMDLVVYDNSPVPSPDSERSPTGWRTHYLHDPSNPGVSAAYNTGCEQAEHLGKRWVLLLDQDTEFPPEALVAYSDGTQRHPTCELFAPVLASNGEVYSPCVVRHGRGAAAPRASTRPGTHSLRDVHVLNSGLLVRTDLFRRAGGYEPAARLDFSDFVFLHRAAAHTNNVCVLDLVCEHDLSTGDTDAHRVRTRFEAYCHGAAVYAEVTRDRLVYATLLLRAAKLAWRQRSLYYLRVAVSSIAP